MDSAFHGSWIIADDGFFLLNALSAASAATLAASETTMGQQRLFFM